jgi:hypothetical protein
MAFRRLCSTSLGHICKRGTETACPVGWRWSTSGSSRYAAENHTPLAVFPSSYGTVVLRCRLADTAACSSSTCGPAEAGPVWQPSAATVSSPPSCSAAAAAPAVSRHAGGCWGLTNLAVSARLQQQQCSQHAPQLGVCPPLHTARSLHTSSHQCSSSGSEGGSTDLQSIPAADAPGRPAAVLGLEDLPSVTDDDIDALMTVSDWRSRHLSLAMQRQHISLGFTPPEAAVAAKLWSSVSSMHCPLLVCCLLHPHSPAAASRHPFQHGPMPCRLSLY